MVGNDSHIGSSQLFGPGLSRKVRNGGSSLLASFGDPSLVQAVMFAVGGVQGMLLVAMPHWRVDHPLMVLGVAVAALGAAPLIWLSRRHLGPGGSKALDAVSYTHLTLPTKRIV